MGNSTSHGLHRRTEEHQSWTNSFPRDPRTARSVKAPQNKVLPERIPGQRLRVTDNGAILLNGGTISGRRQTISLGENASRHDQGRPSDGGRVYRTRSTSTHQHPRQPHSGGNGEGLSKRCGSEPDLRFPHSNHVSSPAKQRISRSRKKYKAPAPPPESHGHDSSSPDSSHWDTLDPPARRARLFKTRAETKKTAHAANRRTLEQEHVGKTVPPPSIQRSLSSPEFQAELLQAARRLRSGPPATVLREAPVGEVTVRRAGSGRESTAEPELTLPLRNANPVPQLPPRKKPEPPKKSGAHWEIIPSVATLQQERHHGVPVKTFYFGMEQGECEAVDRFAASLRVPPAPCSLSSEEPEEENVGSIALQLRPTLPKKQLEIPRFSPTAAWRLLATLDAHQPGATSPAQTEEGSILLEERIQRLSRPVAPPPLQQVLQQQAPRSSHDKSGDSGISGDASPVGIHEDPSEAAAPLCRKPMVQAGSVRPLVMAWTPQQDLEEDEEESSSDGGVEVPPATSAGAVQPKFSPRSHVFSLSLPRDDRLCLSLYADNADVIGSKMVPMQMRDQREAQASFNSLTKLRRSVSGILGAALGNVSAGSPTRGEPLDENWLLSRSVPNSLHLETTWGAQTSSPSSPDQDIRPSFSYLASGGHVMYLPEYQTQCQTSAEDMSFGRGRSHSAGVAASNLRASVPLSKSCDNISAASEMRQLGRTPSPDRRNEVEVPQTTPAPDKRGKGRRFTFQSTVRQIERRRLAEKLSREAELKERQRLGELEAMQRVEEEFQRKRAREKASIRQQLRLFSLDENMYSSLPLGWGDTRADPDGAPSSTPSPASGASSGPSGAGKTPRQTASTQVLSEFHQPSREYREYRQSRYLDSGPESLMPHTEPKRTTVHHPQVVYDMPKSTQVYVAPRHRGDTEMSTPRSSSSDNYRRDFALGARPGRSLASSDSELSQPATRPVSQRQHRSRSASPASGDQSAFSSPEEVPKTDDKTVSCSEDRTMESQLAKAFPPSHFSLTAVQPFIRNNKGYRPIVFNPGATSSHNVAQTVS